MADGRDYGYFWNDDGSGDRTYNADSFEYWLKKFFTTGVFAGDLQVTAGGSYSVDVATGYANVNGKVKDFYDTKTFTVPSANGTYPRIDTIVVRRDDTNKIISLQYVTGKYSGQNPVPTAPTRNGAIYELVLAEIYVGAGATKILQRDITDKRADSTVCGIVAGTVEEMDFSQFTSQFEAYFAEFKEGNEEDFDAWFQEMKDQLSTDAAGHLQLEIKALNDAISNSVLYFSGQVCSALTGDFCTISNAKITANHVVAEAVFANPSAITTDVTWTTASGSLKLNGTCSAATTVNIVLVKKNN